MTEIIQEVTGLDEWLELFDYDSDINCNINGGCNNEAAWIFQHPCCDWADLLCVTHHEQWIEVINQWIRNGGVRCMKCNTPLPENDVEFRPL